MEDAALEGEPIRAISYLPPEHGWDSGFAVFTQPPDTTGDDGELVCLDCLLQDHPEIGKGLDVARRHGEAIRDEDCWIGSG